VESSEVEAYPVSCLVPDEGGAANVVAEDVVAADVVAAEVVAEGGVSTAWTGAAGCPADEVGAAVGDPAGATEVGARGSAVKEGCG